MARRETRLIARNAARWIEYPTAHLTLVGSDWRLALLLRPVALGFVSVIVTLGLRRYVSGRRTLQAARRNRASALVFGGIWLAPFHPTLDSDQ
jgi:hypothetical protein